MGMNGPQRPNKKSRVGPTGGTGVGRRNWVGSIIVGHNQNGRHPIEKSITEKK